MSASFSPRFLGQLVGALTALLVGACSKSAPVGAGESNDVGIAQQPLLAGDTWPTEDFVATNSVFLKQDTVLTGSVAVVTATPGPHLAENSEVTLGNSVTLTGTVRGDSLFLRQASRVVGTAAYNHRAGNGTVVGTATPTLALPLPISVPRVPVVTPGNQNFVVAKSQTLSLNSGAYGNVDLKAGTSAARTKLRLAGGLYQFNELTFGQYSDVNCLAACELRVKGRVLLKQDATIGPISGAGLGPSDLQLIIVATNAGAGGPADSPAALQSGQGSALRAYVFVPNGTAELRQDADFFGKVVARDLLLGSGTGIHGCAAKDLVCDGIDEDCNGVADEDYVSSATSCGVGACAATGTRTCQNGAVVNSCHPGTPAASDATCNNIDDDCDGTKDENYVSGPTSCGVGACAATGTRTCQNGAVVNSCQPGTPAPNDATCNNIDDDCDGTKDENYASGSTSCGVGACAATGTRTCQNGAVVNSCQPGTPAANDATCNNIDDDCDGTKDENYVPSATTCGIGACGATGAQLCQNGTVVNSCQPGTPAANDATCNNIDDDCDGTKDENYVPVSQQCGVGACLRTGNTACVSGAVQSGCVSGAPGPSDATCNGVDENCNGQSDEGFVSQATSCGVGACVRTGATQCVGGTPSNTCAPGTPASNDATCNGVDEDCSGSADEDYVASSTACGVGACANTGTLTCVAGAAVNSCVPGAPAASDASCNGVDENCNGSADEGYVSVPTSCGVGACADTGLASCVAGTIADSCTAEPAAPEDTTCDGVDDDCDGAVDEDYIPVATQCGSGACTGSGTTSCEDGVEEDSCVVGSTGGSDANCDGIDNDCDGVVDDAYVPVVTSCGVGACVAQGMSECIAGTLDDDCQPASPAQADTVCDGIDNDCDGAIDEDFAATPTSCGVGACRGSGQTTCTNGVLGDSCAPGAPAASDTTCDGVDDDCSGVADDDYVSVPTACGVGACAAHGQTSCAGGTLQNSCLPGVAAVLDETCDGVDEDCDGTLDEDVVSAPTGCGVGACARQGATVCVGGQSQNQCIPGAPAPSDATCNGLDDDCDGAIDEGYVPVATNCGVGACADSGETSCVGGTEEDSCQSAEPAAGDSTCDGVDDDCDGTVDEDYVSTPTTCGDGACAGSGFTRCEAGAVADSCRAGTPGSGDTSCNGVDDDCDGTADEDFVSAATACGIGACAANGATVCSAGTVTNTCAPGAPVSGDATCDGVDDDCDGATDEDYEPVPTACGLGACARTGATSCVSGQVAATCVAGAAAPNDSSCNGVDDDCDGTVDEEYASRTTTCGLGACLAAGATSCVDGAETDSCVPDAPALDDASCNGEDDDCDGITDEDYLPVPTSCGVGACAASGTTSCVDGDVVDGCDAGTPGSGDGTCNGVDDDCDGAADEDYLPVPTSCGVGACAANGTSTCVSGAVVQGCTPELPAADDATCNGADDDCDGSVDEDYAGHITACGTGSCGAVGATSCEDGVEEDSCIPGSPGASDASCDGIDNDCDGQVDEGFVNVPSSCGTGACVRAGAVTCIAGHLEDSCSSGTSATSDATCNGVDDDCDGTADEGYVGVATTCGVGACGATGATSCVAGAVTDSCAPGAAASSDETCDGVDDDCDGTPDEGYVGVATTCGVGACGATGATSCVAGAVTDSCAPGAAASSDETCDGVDDDCNGVPDEDYAPIATSCGVGACAATGLTACVGGSVTDSCAPGTAAASDSVCDGIDADCSGVADEDYVAVATSCGVGACVATGLTSCDAGQVADSCAPGNPAASDSACDGIDADCDGSTDEDYVAAPTSCGVGACAAHGTTACIGGGLIDSCTAGVPAPSDATCDAVDDDCDGEADEDYQPLDTTCGVGACSATGLTECVFGEVGNDCAPGTSASSDATCDGIDDDCNGASDEDYVAVATSCGVGACVATGTTRCASGEVSNDCTPGTAASDDATCDGADDDCNGTSDEDYVAAATSCGVGACAATGTTHCASGEVSSDCTPGTAAPDDVTCDGVDDDCSGAADEDYVAVSTSCGVGACAAAGVASCVQGHVSDSCEAGTPTAGDATCNGVDDDCDGTADENYVSIPTQCGVGACRGAGVTSCDAGAVVDSCAPGNPASTDATCNGVDDDCNGASDEDYVAVSTSCGVGACVASGSTSCVAGDVQDSCDPGTGAATDANCDGVDDDCNGTADEDYVGQPTSCGVGACRRNGANQCVGGAIQDSCAPGFPGLGDASCDGVDDDCNGTADEDYVPVPTSCGSGACSRTGNTSCVGGDVVNGCVPGTPASDDASCNGVDDDCNGAVDEDYEPVCSGSSVLTCVDGATQATSCGDADACNGTETCAFARCQSGSSPDPDDGNACTLDACEPSSGVGHTNRPLGATCGASRVCDGAGECIGRPQIVTQPVSTSVSVGQPFSFAVQATGALLSYQWQRLGLNIPGATDSTYTDVTAETSDDGASFQVVVTNPAGSVASSPVTLTVGDTSGPVLTLSTESSFETTDPEALIVGAAVDSASGTEAVTVLNGRYPGLVVSATLNASTGQFSVEVPLAPGVNLLTVVAVDREGNASQAVLSATYRISTVPLIRVTSPPPGTFVSTELVDIAGTVRSGLEADQIRLELGPQVIFPTGTGGEYSFLFEDVHLVPGGNVLSIRAVTPETTVSQSFGLTYGQTGPEAAGEAPKIALPGIASLVYATTPSHHVSGTVSAPNCVAAISVNGQVAAQMGTGAMVSFDHPLTVPGDGEPFPVVVRATGCNGVSAEVRYEVVYDQTAPELSLSVGIAPEINAVVTTPYVIYGTVLEPNLAGLSTNDQSIGLLPSGEGMWDFSLAVPLVAGELEELQIAAWDRAGNRVERKILLQLDSTLAIEIVAPREGERIETLDDPASVSVVTRIPGLAATDVVLASVDGGAPVTLGRAGATATGALELPLASGSHQLVISVHDASSALLAQASRRFELQDAEDTAVELAAVEPAAGSQNVEANQFINLRFNRPIDSSKLSVVVKETAHGTEYASSAPGADITTLAGVEVVTIDRNAELVPGAISPIPGDVLYTFYPLRDYGYGGTVTVNVSYDGQELPRSTFVVRPFPTMIEGFIADQFFNPLPGIHVALPDLGRTTVTDEEGAFRFGFGKFENAIPSGRHRLVANDGLASRNYGRTEIFANAQEGRLSELGVIRTPLLSLERPFALLTSGTANAVLGGGLVTLKLTGATLAFPDGQSSGLVHVDALVAAEVGYAAHPTATPLLTYALQPSGIGVTGTIGLELDLPAFGGEGEYVEHLGNHVILIGVDPDALMLVPIGVGEVDVAARKVRSVGPLAPRRLDFLGIALPPMDATASLEAYAAGELSIPQLIAALQASP